MTQTWQFFALASAFFAALTAIFGKIGVTEISSHGLLFLVLSGVATGLSWLCYYHALSMAPVSKVAPVDKLSVIFTLFLAFLFLGETPTLRIVLGAVLITAGAVVIALA